MEIGSRVVVIEVGHPFWSYEGTIVHKFPYDIEPVYMVNFDIQLHGYRKHNILGSELGLVESTLVEKFPSCKPWRV